jgi:hypothetical protein
MRVSGLRLLPALAALSALLPAGGASAIEPDESPTQSSPTTLSPVATGGLVAVIDPATGTVTEDPELIERLLADPAIQNALSTSSEGLVEEVLPLGGGVRVDLQGRFQSVVVALREPSGRVRIEHRSTPIVPEKSTSEPSRKGQDSMKGGDHEAP